MSTARLAMNMQQAVAGAFAFHGVECAIPATYTGTLAGSWSRNDLKNRKSGSRPTLVTFT